MIYTVIGYTLILCTGDVCVCGGGCLVYAQGCGQPHQKTVMEAQQCVHTG